MFPCLSLSDKLFSLLLPRGAALGACGNASYHRTTKILWRATHSLDILSLYRVFYVEIFFCHPCLYAFTLQLVLARSLRLGSSGRWSCGSFRDVPIFGN